MIDFGNFSLKIRILKIASCRCLTKTNDFNYHKENCDYRILSELEELIPQLKKNQEDARLYEWLRDLPYRRRYRPDNPLYVIDPEKSRLYAVMALRGQNLDDAIRDQILWDLVNHLSDEQKINGDARFKDPDWQFSNERTDELEQLARKQLGYE